MAAVSVTTGEISLSTTIGPTTTKMRIVPRPIGEKVFCGLQAWSSDKQVATLEYPLNRAIRFSPSPIIY
jgi:hypothetical protein